MEEQEQTTKKKYLGLSPLVIIIGMIVLVSAVTTVYIYQSYNHDFTKVIDVFNDDGSSGEVDETITYTIVGSGDLTNSTIRCNKQGETCVSKSGDISLVNSANIERTCNLVSSDLTNMAVTTSLGTNTIVIPAGGSSLFNMIYTASAEGNYSVTTNINCPEIPSS